jgi:8-oxo-dGTP pyrophosphatase MutT (NUDIX family)
VLLPLIETEDGLHILFEIRANHLRRQPGEICFPGGAVEKGEICNPQETAVRETIEELGIKNNEIELLGTLNCFIAPPGTIIYPYVGLIKRKESIKPNPAEVEGFFLAPVEYFLKHPPTKSSVEVATRYNDDFPFNKVPPFYRIKDGLSRFISTSTRNILSGGLPPGCCTALLPLIMIWKMTVDGLRRYNRWSIFFKKVGFALSPLWTTAGCLLKPR